LHVVKERPQRELCALLAIRFLIANNSRRWRGIFEEHSQDGGRPEVDENLHAVPLNDVLSVKTTVSQILLNKQYL
jgi:hypothetical protein